MVIDDDDDPPCSPLESNFPGYLLCLYVLNHNPVGPVLAC
jgi:hypothetical protein